ncbi:ParB/RepB/Spo0J family partition protein [Nocardiopsis terrae]
MSKADKLGKSSSFGAAGRTISARRQLISQAAGEAPEDPNRVPLGRLAGNPENPRESLGELEELARSLSEQGLLQPLHVLPRRAYLQVHAEHEAAIGDAAFVVVNGNRRLAAARQAGLETVAVHVRTPRGEQPEDQVSLRAAVLAENIHRQDLHPLEEAGEINKLLDHGLNRSEAASLLGKSNGWITQRLLLLNLHPDLQRQLRAGELKLARARELGKLPAEEQLAAHEEQQEGFYAVKPAPTPAPAPKEGAGPAGEEGPAAEGSSAGAGQRAPRAAGQLTLNLRMDEPEVLAETLYKELSSGMDAQQFRRFVEKLIERL